MIKVAIIGAGLISQVHIEAFLKLGSRCEIVAVSDIFVEKAQEKVTRFGLNAKVVKDYKELLNEEIDLVSVCTPPFTHAPITIDFLNHGKNVLVEKPMASSLEECDLMNEAAKSSGKLLSVVAQNRFKTPMMKLKAVLDSTMIGQIVHAQVDSFWWRGHSYYDLWWRGTWEKEGGGCTLNHAVHHIDALLWMMGRPSELTAVMSNVAHDNAEIEDVSIAILRYPNGALVQLTSSLLHHGEEQQLIFQGSSARVSAPWKVFASQSQPNGFPCLNEQLKDDIQAYYDELPEVVYDGHTGQIDNVLNALETGDPLLIDGEKGRATLELIVGIYKAASLKQTVKFPIEQNDLFYTREGMQKNATHFYEKKTSIDNFTEETLTLGNIT